MYQNEPGLWNEVVECLGDYSALDKRLYRAREKVVGKAPKNRNQFDPNAFFDNGSDVIVLDSNNLPDGWKTDIEAKVSENESARTREWGNTNAKAREYEKSMDEFEQSVVGELDELAQVEEMDEEEQTEEQGNLPKGVLAFTSKKLLTLFETNLTGRSSLDGTFKSVPVLWKQLFIWMIKYNGFWIPVVWSWLPDKSAESYKVLIHMVQDKLKELNINFNINEIISDFEINIQKAADHLITGIRILGCFFHLSKCFWKRLQMKGMVTEYDDNVEFRDFVKSAIALAHLPLTDLEEGVEYLKSVQFDDDKCKEFQNYLCTYIEEYWINGPFPPQVWNCFKRTEDLTNNNQEGFNSKINKEVKQIHPTPGQLAMYIKKQIKLSEIDIMRADSGFSKPKQRKIYKKLYERRKKMKRNYNKARLPQYLLSMGSSLIAAHLNSGREDDPKESSAPLADVEINANERSNWREENDEDGLDSENEMDNDDQEDPYEGRRIGGKRKEKKKTIGKKKCPSCGKGFNVKSNFTECHDCDKLTHVKCVTYLQDEENFQCIECKPAQPDDATDEHGQEETGQEDLARLDAIGQEAILSEDESSSVEPGQETALEDLTRYDAIGQETFPVEVQPEVSVQQGNIREFLHRIGMEQFADLFEQEMIDLDTLKEMNHEDLKSVGVNTFGQRHKIIKEILNPKSKNIVNNIVSNETTNCEKTFGSQLELIEHEKSHQTEKDSPRESILLSEVILNFGCDSCDSILETVSELNDHTRTQHATQQDTCYGGGNLYDSSQFPVLTMNATQIENIGESTRIDIHKYQCERCEFNSSYMDELIMHANTKHIANYVNDAEGDSNYPNVTIIDDSVEEIVDLVTKKRKYANNCNRSDVKRLKYKLYD